MCATSDGGADAASEAEAGPEPTPEAGPDADSCAPTNTACGSQVCGTAPDGCGGVVACGPLNGTCIPGLVCSPGGQCGDCINSCPAGDNCGTISNNPGCMPALRSCGTCGSTNPNEVCGGGPNPRPNVCGCTPTTCAAAAATCGTLPDGCGGVVQCGSCSSDQACGADGQCHPRCDPNSSTLSCLQAQDKPTSPPTLKCSTCVQANGCFDPLQLGGTCESLTENASLFAETLPDGKTCSQVIGPAPVSERTICFQTLSGIFSSKCAASLQEAPCVCGTTDVAACLAGTVTPNGPLDDEYSCDFGSTSVSTINAIATNFTVQTFGAGMANSIVQCATVFGCECF